MKTIRILTGSIITFTLLMLLPLQCRAGCTQPSPTDAVPLYYDATSALNSAGSASVTQRTNYPGSFKCNAPPWGILGGKNTVANLSPYTSNTIYLKFPGDAYVSVSVTGLTPQQVNPSVGSNSASSINASFTINLKLMKTVPTKNVMTVNGDLATIKPIVLAQDNTGLTLLQSISRLITDFTYFIFHWSWPQHDYDIYYQSIQIRFVKSVTTCQFDDANKTVVLNNIDRSSLLSGSSNGKKDFTLNFTCALYQNKIATRSVQAFLSSRYLLASDNTTLISSAPDAAGGVGIRLAKASDNIPLKMSSLSSAQGNATALFSYSAYQVMPPVLSIPMSAWYYVYNKDALSSGPVRTTAVLNFVYD
ncbi:fimbrial protein [Erwinia sorbitola]|uniref:Fimbrial protein n=1 Tax=Erwinia sorbitola TaxID=2681984 RepID=A0ABW9RBN0_9GAMM|nr:fimbrial protein [Erwinia sorbitola]MTD27444.1 fimbrial protein [Erwinia sorbitola]